MSLRKKYKAVLRQFHGSALERHHDEFFDNKLRLLDEELLETLGEDRDTEGTLDYLLDKCPEIIIQNNTWYALVQAAKAGFLTPNFRPITPEHLEFRGYLHEFGPMMTDWEQVLLSELAGAPHEAQEPPTHQDRT